MSTRVCLFVVFEVVVVRMFAKCLGQTNVVVPSDMCWRYACTLILYAGD